MAADAINQGAFAEAEKHLAQAAGELGSVAAERQGRVQATLGILRLSLAGYLGDTPTVADEAQRLLAVAADGNDSGLAISGERRALALISLGMAETWTLRHVEAEHHLDQGVRLAGELGFPYLELLGRAHGARIVKGQSVELGAKRCLGGDRDGHPARLGRAARWSASLTCSSAGPSSIRGTWRRRGDGSIAPSRSSAPNLTQPPA